MITFPNIDTIFSNRPSMTFSISEGVEACVKASFRTDTESEWEEIWDETYNTVGGRVTLYDIGQLVGDRLGGCIAGFVKFDIEERDYGTSISQSSRVYNAMLCECDEAGDVAEDGFLTMFRGIKTTFVGAKEDMYFFEQGVTEYTVLAEYITDAGYLEMETRTPAAETTAGVNAAIKRIDVSPGLFTEEGKSLAHLTLKVSDSRGMRSMEWMVAGQEPVTRMMFRNSFGLPEVLCFYGAETRDIEQERSSALIAGYNRNYRVQDKTKHTADTGIMTQGMALMAEDLMRTEECYVLDDSNRIAREIRITGGKAKRTSEDTETPRFEIEYEYARVQMRSRGNEYSAARIFDDSFDLKFN